jgi:hypothetical protein
VGNTPAAKRIHETINAGTSGRRMVGGRHNMRRWVTDNGKVVGGGEGLEDVGLMSAM